MPITTLDAGTDRTARRSPLAAIAVAFLAASVIVGIIRFSPRALRRMRCRREELMDGIVTLGSDRADAGQPMPAPEGVPVHV